MSAAKKNTGPAPVQPNHTTEQLTITKEKRQKGEALFLVRGPVQSERARWMFDYVHYTISEVIAAMHENADKNADELHLTTQTRTTMAKALAVAKAWVLSKAVDLVEAPDQDWCLQKLTQIADITPGELAGYQRPKKDWAGERAEYSVVRVSPHPKARTQFPPYDAEIPWGSGEKVLGAIVESFLEERVETSPEQAIKWLDQYRCGVVYAAAQYRKNRQAHNTRAAAARKGSGDGENKRAPRVPDGGKKKKKGAEEPVIPPVTPVVTSGKKGKSPKPLTPSEITANLTTYQLIVLVTKRVADYDVAITVKEDKAIGELNEHYERRFKRVNVGMTEAQTTAARKASARKLKARQKGAAKMAAAPASPAAAPVKVITARNVTPIVRTPEKSQQITASAGFATSAAVNRALLAEERAGHITAKKRKQIMLQVFEGRMTEAQFKARLAKIQGKTLAAAGR